VESTNQVQSLQNAIKILNVHHYQASWEARLNGPRFYLRNCPYAALLGDHPELCNMDRLILETLIKKPVHQIAKMGFGLEVSLFCVFEFDGM
jgi:hypothetical protein